MKLRLKNFTPMALATTVKWLLYPSNIFHTTDVTFIVANDANDANNT